MTLDGGASNAGKVYLLLGSASGTAPGFMVDGLNLPLNVDGFFTYLLNFPNAAPYSGSLGFLNGFGVGSTTINVPPGSFPSLAGLTLNHAFVVHNGINVVLTSNAQSLTLLP